MTQMFIEWLDGSAVVRLPVGILVDQDFKPDLYTNFDKDYWKIGFDSNYISEFSQTIFEAAKFHVLI